MANFGTRGYSEKRPVDRWYVNMKNEERMEREIGRTREVCDHNHLDEFDEMICDESDNEDIFNDED